MWTDNVALVKRMTILVELDPVAANLKNDPDLYCGIGNAAKKMKIEELGNVKGHQDSFLSMVEKLNVIADKLVSKSVNKVRFSEPEWHKSRGPMLKFDGKVITKRRA